MKDQSMDTITREELKTLMGLRKNECVSLYMPTHRTGPEVQQDPIRLKNLLREAEERLLAKNMRAATARALLAPASDLIENESFWLHQNDGLAIFLAPEEFYHYRLPLQFPELTVVATRFHMKPLLPLLSSDRFLILALSQNTVRLFNCTQHSANEIPLVGVPTSMAEALQYDNLQKQLQFHTGTPTSGSGKRPAMFHGQGVSIDDTKDHLLRYFQELNKGLQKFLRDEQAPLLLAGVEYLFPIYQEANTYPHLLSEGIAGNPEERSEQELQQLGWALVRPLFRRVQQETAARYQQLEGTGRASSLLEEVVPAAYQGRVESVFVPIDIQQWGIFDSTDHSVFIHQDAQPGDEDLLDFVAVHTFLNSGTVYAVRPEEIPSHTSLAAVFRY